MLIIASYVAAVCIKRKGVPYSISATYYSLEHPYWFMATMWLTAGLLMPAILEVSSEASQWAAFVACVGMILVGAAPKFQEEFEGNIHTAGAILCLLGSQIWVGANCAWCLFVWLAWAVYTAVMMSRYVSDSIISDFYRTKPMFWIEIAALVSTYLTLLIRI